MKSINIGNMLTSKKVKTKYLLLDANNPRIFSIDKERVTGKGMVKKSVQVKALNEMEKYAIVQLAESIRTTGYNGVDRIVAVRAYPGSEYYVVIEGNRRLAAIRKVLFEFENGLGIDREVIESISEMNVVIIDDGESYYDNTSSSQLMIQALKHISGVKSWSPIAQARAMLEFVEVNGLTASEAARIVGMSRTKANVRRRALLAFNNMLNHESIVFPENKSSIEDYFSFFEELYKDKNLRTYYMWCDDKKVYQNDKELLEFYKWIGLTSNETSKRQIPGALDIRLLHDVLNHEEACRVFRSGLDIHNAHAIILRESSDVKINYSKQLKKINDQLEKLPSTFIRNINKRDMRMLQYILTTVKEHLGEIHEQAS